MTFAIALRRAVLFLAAALTLTPAPGGCSNESFKPGGDRWRHGR